MTSMDLIGIAGVTYRQLDHWVARGYVSPDPRSKASSGVSRSWTEDEAEVVRRMKMLVDAGFVPEIAVQYARSTPGLVALTPFADLQILE